MSKGLACGLQSGGMNIKIRKTIIYMTALSAVVLVAVAINYRIAGHIVEKTIVL